MIKKNCLFQFVFSVLILTLLVVSCKQDVVQSRSSTLRLNIADAPRTFDPRDAIFSNSLNIYSLLYDGLFRIGQNRKIVPSIAETVEISPDGLHYIFHLRKSNWCNGDPVTAYDFERAWKWRLTPLHASLYVERFFIIKNAKKIYAGQVNIEWLGVYAKDQDTLVVDLEEPCDYFLNMLAELSFCFYPLHPIYPEMTNGPFITEEYRTDSYLKVIKNPNYWDAKNVLLDAVEISFIDDCNTEYLLFEKNQIDFTGQPLNNGIPTNLLGHLKEVYKVPTSGILFYPFNVNHPLLKNKKVRKALSLAIDRQQIVDFITLRGDVPALTLISQEECIPIPSDEELMALFEEGWQEAGKPTRHFVLTYNSSELQTTLVQFMHSRWTNLFQIEVTLNAIDWKGHLYLLSNGLFDCTRSSWRSFGDDPISLLELFEDAKHPMQYTNWSHPRFLEVFCKGRKTTERMQRKALIEEAIAIFNEETPVMPLYYSSICYAKNPRLKGEVAAGYVVDFKWAYFEKAEK